MTHHATTPTCERRVELDTYLQLLADGHIAERLIKIRYVTNRGMSRLFIPVRRANAAARTIASLADRTDVYCGVLLRARRAGGRDAVADAQLAWVEIDRPDALDRLARFEHPPSLIVTSGIIRSRRVWACSAWGNAGWRHVVDRADGVDARGARTTYDMYDLSVGGFDRRGQTMLVAGGGVDER